MSAELISKNGNEVTVQFTVKLTVAMLNDEQALLQSLNEAGQIAMMPMLELGLQCSPALLNKISAVTVPLRRNSSSFGFILITSSSQNELTSNALNKIRAVSNGLSVVIESCETSCYSQD